MKYSDQPSETYESDVGKGRKELKLGTTTLTLLFRIKLDWFNFVAFLNYCASVQFSHVSLVCSIWYGSFANDAVHWQVHAVYGRLGSGVPGAGLGRMGCRIGQICLASHLATLHLP